MARTRRLLLLLPFGLALAGCGATDPYQRAGIWRPTNANDSNIAAMVANPADLGSGRGDTGGTVRTGTGAVERVWRGSSQGGQNQGGNPLAALLGGMRGGGGGGGGEPQR